MTEQTKVVSDHDDDKDTAGEYHRLVNMDTKEYNIVQDWGNETSNGMWSSEVKAIMDVTTLKSVLLSEDWPFICCDRIASKISGQRLRVVKDTVRDGKTVTEEVPNHPVNAMLKNPNEYQTYYQWMYSYVFDMVGCGNGVTWVAFASRQLVQIPIENIFIDVDTQGSKVRSYQVLAGSQEDYPLIKAALTIPPSQIAHARRPNPSSMLWGLSPFIPGRKSVLFNRYSSEYLVNYYSKGALPGLALEIGDKANEKLALRLLRSFEMAYTGRRNQRRNLVVPKGVSVKEISHKLADQELNEYLNSNRETIINLLAIPKHEFSIQEAGSLGSEEVKTSLRYFWSATLKPLMGLVAETLTKTMMPLLNKGERLEFDLSDVEILRDDESNKADLAIKMLQTHTLNEVRAKLYNAEALAGGDTKPGPMLPAQGFSSGNLAPQPASTDVGIKPTSTDPELPAAASENQITTPKMALNGAQVSSMVEVVQQVEAGTLTRDSAIAIIRVAFALDEETARAVVGDGSATVKPEPTVEVPQQQSAPVVNVKDVYIRNSERLGPLLKSADGWWDKRQSMINESAAKGQDELSKIVTDLFANQVTEMLKAVKSQVKEKSKTEKAELVSKAELRRRLRNANLKFEERFINDFVKALEAQVDVGYDSSLVLPFNVPNQDEIEAIRSRNAKGRREVLELRGLKTFEAMSKTNTEQVMKIIEEGMKSGATIDDMVKSIKEKITAPEATASRLATIARTETLTAVSIGQAAAMADAATVIPNLKKSWVNAGDERVRGNPGGLSPNSEADHWDMQGQVKAHDKPFVDPRSGAKLMFPRDPEAGPENVINCRCAFIMIPGEDAAKLGFEDIHSEEDV